MGVLPSITLAILLFGLIFSWSETLSVTPNLDTLVTRINTLDLKEGILIFIAVIVFSIIIYPLQIQIVRVFEGYWSAQKPFGMLYNIGIKLQKYKT